MLKTQIKKGPRSNSPLIGDGFGRWIALLHQMLRQMDGHYLETGCSELNGSIRRRLGVVLTALTEQSLIRTISAFCEKRPPDVNHIRNNYSLRLCVFASLLLHLPTTQHVEFVATPALTPALSPRRGRILRRLLRQRQPSALRQFSPVNHPPAAPGHSTSDSSQRVHSLSPLPGGEGQGEGERHTNFVPAQNRGKGMIGKGIKSKPGEFSAPIPLPYIPLPCPLLSAVKTFSPRRLCPFAPLR